MAVVQVIKQSFDNAETGKPVEYERLAIMGYMDGKEYTLLIKLTQAELLSAKMLLNSKGAAPGIETHKATKDEQPEVKRNILDELDNEGLFD